MANKRSITLEEFFQSKDDEFERTRLADSKEVFDIVQVLIKARKDMGMTQVELAKIADMPQSTIARVENLSFVPKINTIVTIARCLKVSIYFVPTGFTEVIKSDSIDEKYSMLPQETSSTYFLNKKKEESLKYERN